MFFNFVLIIATIFTRFVGINWGKGYFFHPDENNMAWALSNLSLHNLNPHFFAYNQFPLYLSFFTFGKSNLSLRIWSAIFSCLAIYVFYLLGKKIFKKNNYIFILLLIFNPGLIQLAHFGTTESILIFVFATNIYLAFLIKEKFKFKYVIFASLISAIGIATKISAVFFIIPILLVVNKNLRSTIYYLLSTLLFSCILTPYSLLAYPEFISSMKYEIGVASGSIPVFYTKQFVNTIPYIFQFQKIFPYVSGIFIYILAFFGIFKINKKIKNLKLIFIPAIIYFLYQGQLFVKWTRFMAPIFFVFPFLATFFIIALKNKYLKNTLIIISILPAIFFLKLYFINDIRLQASSWANNNLPQNSQILTESNNVYDIPVNNINKYKIVSYNFYDNDSPPLLKYYIIPSRRVFKNFTSSFYQSLFSGELGYELIKQITPNNYFILNDENAEETWTVFDRPTIRIYEKTK